MSTELHHVVIVGAGFGGLNAAVKLNDPHIRVTIIDEKNHHLFQPLLYQVATGGLSPADISAPIRGLFKKNKNVSVVMGRVTDINPKANTVLVNDITITYDSLVLAAGVEQHYFGNTEWQNYAPSLKSLKEATHIRNNIFTAFEKAELAASHQERQKHLTFVVVGGGPTGVEMAGAIGELAHQTLKGNFRSFESTQARVILVEAKSRILVGYHTKSAIKATIQLQKMGVKVETDTAVVDVTRDGVVVSEDGEERLIESSTLFWAAGVKASFLGTVLHKRIDAETDKSARVVVNKYCQIPGWESIFVIGDLAIFTDENGDALPGLAPVAIQQGKYIAKQIRNRHQNKSLSPFKYTHKGMMAVIGRGYAISEFKKVKSAGLFAWLLWLFVHLMYLVGFENRILVFLQWAWNYSTKNRSARIISGD